MTTALIVFNTALALLGERSLVATSDNTEPARVLTALADAAYRYCLEQGPWKFAERQATLTAISPPEATFGLAKGYAKPSDYVRLISIAADSAFTTPLTGFHEKRGHFYSDSTTAYALYVSNDAAYGGDLSLWPEAFAQFAAYYLAIKAAPRIAPHLMAEIVPPDSKGAAGYLSRGLDQALRLAIEYNQHSAGPSHFWDTTEPSQLSIFNNALNLLGAPQLARQTDSLEEARVLHGLWPHVRDYCLEQGRWKFAEREVSIDKSGSEVPTFGLANAFAKPTDMIRVNEVAADEYFNAPLTQIHDRGAYWYCELSTIYVRYISKDTSFGYDISKWPESFVLFVTLYLATRAAPRLAPDSKQELILSAGGVGLREAKLNALSKDAVSGPTQFLPAGNWSRSRSGRSHRERNQRGSFYGT